MSDLIAVVSPMGLELSGLAITVSRYAAALRTAGLQTLELVAGRFQAEQGTATAVGSLKHVSSQLRGLGTVGTVLWTGLHTDTVALGEQLQIMRSLRCSGWANVVIPERTGVPSQSDYSAFVHEVDRGTISALIHLNERQHLQWVDRVALPMHVGPPPLPDVLFGLRQPNAQSASEQDFAIVFIGRLTHRKGFDRLQRWWPAWADALASVGTVATLHVYGRSFSHPPVDRSFEWLSRETNVRWRPSFPCRRDISGWPARTVGIALSRQEFDGIAVSEMLACGLPVLATPTDGHLALAAECRSVSICTTRDEFKAELTAMSLDSVEFTERSERARLDIRKTRSTSTVGDGIAEFLRHLSAYSRTAGDQS